MQSKQPILEVCLLRLVLIVLLVLDHSFAPFSGFWPMPEGVETSSEPYWWFGRLSFSFMLECFTFVSGWVLGTQVLTKGSQVLNFKRLILSKVKRLLVPCAVFGVVYILLATPQAFANPLHALNVLANGVGHLWYLPMLFWCFVALWIIERAKLNKNQVLIALLLLAVFSVFPFQLRLGKTMYYMFFFYVGYLVGIKHFQLPHFPSWRTVATLGCAFAVTFVLGNQLVVRNCKLLEIIQMGGVIY